MNWFSERKLNGPQTFFPVQQTHGFSNNSEPSTSCCITGSFGPSVSLRSIFLVIAAQVTAQADPPACSSCKSLCRPPCRSPLPPEAALTCCHRGSCLQVPTSSWTCRPPASSYGSPPWPASASLSCCTGEAAAYDPPPPWMVPQPGENKTPLAGVSFTGKFGLFVNV